MNRKNISIEEKKAKKAAYNKKYQKKYREEHREERNAKEREYYAKNPEPYKASQKKYRKKYRKSHKEELAIYAKKMYYADIEASRAKAKEYRKVRKGKKVKYRASRREIENAQARERRRTDPNFRIKCSLSSRVRIALHGNPKLSVTMNLIGCSIGYFREYLTKQFTEGMTWDNYGLHGWHMDHIKPCDSFDLTNEKEQRACFHYSNIQPLWAIDNLTKGSSYE